MRKQVTCDYLGRLADLGLGAGRIASPLIDDETLKAFAKMLPAHLVKVTDAAHDACIDGRQAIRQYSGASPAVRSRRAGAGLANEIMALLGEVPLPDVSSTATLEQKMAAIDRLVWDALGKAASSHGGESEGHFVADCGAATGLITHLKSIAATPLQEAIQGFVTQPVVKSALPFGAATFLSLEWLASGASDLADQLTAEKWDGEHYTQSVIATEPNGVEVLQAADDESHGHQEKAIVIVLASGFSINLPDVFVWNLDESIHAAQALGGADAQMVAQNLLTDIAFHLAVAHNLCAKDMPVFVVRKS